VSAAGGATEESVACLELLQAAFPAFSFSIGPGWRGPVFEARGDPGASGLYALITDDPGELWRELAAARAGRLSPAGQASARGELR